MNQLLIVVTVAVAAFSLCVFYFSNQKPPALLQSAKQLNASYDFIVVGAGSAGSVVASRLSENGKFSVLLVEAGEEPPYYVHIPGYEGMLQKNHFDWQYLTVPQKTACKSLRHQRDPWPTGKALGGTGIHNYMQYHRGHPADYEHWKKLGNEGWGYDDVLPFFKKAEEVIIPELRQSDVRGHSGPLKVTFTERLLLNQLLMESAKQLGYPTVEDHNDGKSTESFSYCQQVVVNGVRQSTYMTYLKPAMQNRPNLHVLTNAHVTKVLFDGNRAVGIQLIQYSDPDTVIQVKVSRDVILSAGAVGSAHILLLSGIGPSEHLKSVNIPVVKDLPVGKYLIDHMHCDLTFTMNESIGIDQLALGRSFGWAKALLNYHLFKAGPLSNTANGVNAQLVSGLNLDDPRPDVQLVALPLSFYHPKMAPVLQHMIPEHAQAAFGFTTKQHSACITAIALHPSNYGEIKLASSDPFVHPLIDPKYLESAKDVEVLLFGLKTILKVANQKALRPYDFRFGEEPIPSCRQYKLLTDDYLRCHIEHRTATLYHPVSSCRMGPDPATSVVDNKLRVHGIHGLRVADASAFPDQVSGNTNTPTIMLAEKAAHIILEQYSSLP